MGSEVPSIGAAVPGHRRVRDVVREVVSEVAPEELVLLNGLLQYDDATVISKLTGSGRRRESLGFGIGEVVVLVTPVVWLTVDQAARRAGEVAAENVARGTGTVLRRLFRRRSSESVAVPLFTREQLRGVRQQVQDAVLDLGLSQDRASAIADAVVSRLALDSAGQPPAAPGHEVAGGNGDSDGGVDNCGIGSTSGTGARNLDTADGPGMLLDVPPVAPQDQGRILSMVAGPQVRIKRPGIPPSQVEPVGHELAAAAEMSLDMALAKIFVLRRSDAGDMSAVALTARGATQATAQDRRQVPPVP
ncbi:hypothetical protein ACFZDG_26765 [Kitasatospora xanthocidica]|uniref:hypothetical protein n=1 Tax=Kitasatospora xanthocidica TaxID=83382 RepID=UPI0036F17554